ncbi:helix-turn-helix domain-containing protein (plasmid) [Kovacikia minuta CCNUW1]|nr:helix-turn-helix domain-containing protein [Kovacikia minuta CCNUW1]
MVKKTTALGQPEVRHLIRELRHITGLSQEQFAAMLGVAFSTINRWENGHMQPSPLALKQIQMILKDLSGSPAAKLQERSQILLNQYFTEMESDVQ